MLVCRNISGHVSRERKGAAMSLDAFSSATGRLLLPALYRPARLERHAFPGNRQGERLSR